MTRLRSLLYAAGVAAFALTGAGTAASAETIRLMTGPQGGSWYPLGGAIKNLIEKAVPGTSVQVLPGAGIANVKGVEAGKAQLGFANSISTVDAVKGAEPFETPAKDTCNIGVLYPQYFQVVALADAGIEDAGDAKGKSLATQPAGNTGEQITRQLLSVYGLGYDDLGKVNFVSYTDAVALMKDDNAQLFTLGTTVPAGAIMDLASARDIRLIGVPDDKLAALKEQNPGFVRRVIPAGSYPGQDEDVAAVGYSTHLIAQCSLDEDFVYQVTKALVDGIPDMAAIVKAMQGLDAKAMGEDVGVPMHPGAAKFYKEMM